MNVDVERDYLANVARICPNAFEPTVGYRVVPPKPIFPGPRGSEKTCTTIEWMNWQSWRKS